MKNNKLPPLEAFDISEEEEARIMAAALADPDAQPWDGKGGVVHAREVPEKTARMKQAAEEGIREWREKQANIRLDPDVLDHFINAGSDVETCVNDTLRKVMKQDLEEVS